jgi:1-deoxy-D-xylulose-5-phosphate reductoisomerase
MKKIVILGSTGSIGCQTLDVIRSFPGEFKVVGLAAGNNLPLLLKQVREFQPRYISCLTPPDALPPGVELTSLVEMVCLEEVDLVMMATSGSVGLVPTLEALKHQKAVALCNKEPIVMAGDLVKEYERRYGGTVLPVDSEPSAIWQCLQGEYDSIRRLIITASGGPFRTTPLEELASVTPAQALKHPTWQMGRKITIDSATLMNKAFEVIESHWLFSVPWDKIEVVVHPQSTIHSMVELADGSVKAQLGPPNMRLPIQYALFYPNRLANDLIPRLDISVAQSLSFQPLEEERYPCFNLALEAARRGGTFPTALSAADEAAVGAFLAGKIGFTDIYRVVESVLSKHQPLPGRDVAEILEAEDWATRYATGIIEEMYSWLPS